jgi:hypothetical protein
MIPLVSPGIEEIETRLNREGECSQVECKIYAAALAFERQDVENSLPNM